jgi:hypothetical protein
VNQFGVGLLVEVLVHEALLGKNRLPAVEVIFDRLEGRSRQHLEIADVTAELRKLSPACPRCPGILDSRLYTQIDGILPAHLGMQTASFSPGLGSTDCNCVRTVRNGSHIRCC